MRSNKGMWARLVTSKIMREQKNLSRTDRAGWKKSDEENGNLSLDDEEDKIPLAIICSRLQFPESMTFEDYVNIGRNVQNDEQLTET